MGKLPQILPKNWQSPICCDQTAQHMKTGKYSFARGIVAVHFGEKYASLPLPISELAWRSRYAAI